MSSAWGKAFGPNFGAAFGAVITPPPVISHPADTFNYAAAFNPTLGRYTADPIISRMAQRQHLTRKRK